ncbi:MAG: thioredoxin fold domain-containing protein [Polyangiaceae bacterium]|nr:thioredoxin fold domain-containing protein [Polyangiaceae bacterium]MCB9605220.1 thioredoxin fold domain-containing protein [Polyangiaceae bacterium]
MALAQISEQTFEQEVLHSELPVMVEFGAEWCGPCKTVAPELAALAQELEGKAKIVTVDIDKSPMLARALGIQSVPTFVVFHNGQPAGGKAGAMKRAELRKLIEPFLPRTAGALKPEEVAELLKRGQISLVDTREAPVFARAHLPGAANLPLEEIESRLAELHMLPAEPVLYCRSGDKTKELAEKLSEQGVPVNFLEGGVLNWEAAGFELERPD